MRLRPLLRPLPIRRTPHRHHRLPIRLNHALAHTPPPAPAPLRILFAGSDDFSSVSLRALHCEHVANPALIASIDVLCREDGRTGRKRDILREVPIKAVARGLQLPLHSIPSFEDWQPPQAVDLIVAVSFGLFIPARVIDGATYGGVNVHPSLLPRHRGAAPLQHTLLDGDTETGVTVQTLDRARFDAGTILLQTTPPMPVPREGRPGRYRALHAALAAHGADLLVETLRRRLFVPPLQPLTSPYARSLARKITPEDGHVDWQRWTADDMCLRAEILGSVWTELGTLIDDHRSSPRKRTILSGLEPLDPKIAKEVVEQGQWEGDEEVGVGCFRYHRWPEKMVLRCCDGWVRVGAVRVESKREVDGATWIRSLQGRGVGRRFW